MARVTKPRMEFKSRFSAKWRDKPALVEAANRIAERAEWRREHPAKAEQTPGFDGYKF